MSARFCLLLALGFKSLLLSSTYAQPLELSQEVALDREGHAALWAVDTPLEAPLRQRAGVRLGLRHAGWLSSCAELRVSWAQRPSLIRLGASVWPIGEPLRGIFVTMGPMLSFGAGASTDIDAFAEAGFRYGWQGLALTLGVRWDLKRVQPAPATTVMLGYTFGGTT